MVYMVEKKTVLHCVFINSEKVETYSRRKAQCICLLYSLDVHDRS